MDHRRPVIRTIADAEAMHAQLLASAAGTAEWLRSFPGDPMPFLRALRFETVGKDALTGEPLNVVEQLNQTFTILVSLRAVERIELHPEADEFRLALGTSSGRDIESVEPNLVAAEVFSATRPTRNQKLRKDLARLSADPAPHRYVFFAAPGFAPGRQEGAVLEAQAECQLEVFHAANDCRRSTVAAPGPTLACKCRTPRSATRG